MLSGISVLHHTGDLGDVKRRNTLAEKTGEAERSPNGELPSPTDRYLPTVELLKRKEVPQLLFGISLS